MKYYSSFLKIYQKSRNKNDNTNNNICKTKINNKHFVLSKCTYVKIVLMCRQEFVRLKTVNLMLLVPFMHFDSQMWTSQDDPLLRRKKSILVKATTTTKLTESDHMIPSIHYRMERWEFIQKTKRTFNIAVRDSKSGFAFAIGYFLHI